jgi:hypothetical protein
MSPLQNKFKKLTNVIPFVGPRQMSAKDAAYLAVQMNDEIPPPNKRLCVKHQRPICVSKWKHGYRTNGCAKCAYEWRRSPKARKRREKRWDETFISCSFHDDRRCNRSYFVCNGKRRCCSCLHRNVPSKGGAKKVGHIKIERKRKYNKMLRHRRFYGPAAIR